MHKKWHLVGIFSALLLFAGPLFAQQMNSHATMLSSADRNFITTAAQANLAEIQTAKMVEQKTTDPAVKDFASRMITDHMQANQQLSKVADRAGVQLPTKPSTAELGQKDELQQLSGAKLNDAYIHAQLQDHKQVISEFEQEIDHGQDHAVKEFAEQTLPTLQDHIRIAEDVSGKMGMSGKAGLTDEAKAIAVK